jgi:hypothetical protein
MNVSLVQDLSVSVLPRSGVHLPIKAVPVSPVNLLSLIRSQIDLLIEQQISASLWVKLPPLNIYHSEVARYYQQVHTPASLHIYDPKKNKKRYKFIPTHSLVEIPINSKLEREYFFIVLSQQFCSLILAYRQLKSDNKQNSSLLAITSFEDRVIQQVLESINIKVDKTNFNCPTTLEPTLFNQLVIKQLQRQDEINRYISAKRIAKLEKQKHKLSYTLEQKDEYLHSICQELRTPLTHMKTALSLLNSPSLKPPQRQRYLQMLNTLCDRQNSLITGLLDLLELDRNLEGTALESVRLCDIVPGVVSTYQPLAQEKGIMLAYTVPTELPAVWCVTGGLRQIVINLLHNSIKFTPNGGQVWVRGRTQGDKVQLEFRDTGIGIADSEIPKIFDRFYRVRSTATEDLGGAGLGLTIVQHLLSRSGGLISVKSKPLEGSTFTVQLNRDASYSPS